MAKHSRFSDSDSDEDSGLSPLRACEEKVEQLQDENILWCVCGRRSVCQCCLGFAKWPVMVIVVAVLLGRPFCRARGCCRAATCVPVAVSAVLLLPLLGPVLCCCYHDCGLCCAVVTTTWACAVLLLPLLGPVLCCAAVTTTWA